MNQLQRRKSKNRLQSSVDALMQKHTTGNDQNQQNPLHQVGAVLQQQFRGFRRRYSSNLPLQAIATDDEDSLHSEANFDQWSFASDTATTSATSSVAEPYYNYFDDEDDERKLTPKKKSECSPLPKSTTKIALYSDDVSVDSLPAALYLWIDAANQLLRSPEMSDVLSSSCTVFYQAGVLVVRTVTLPIRLPIQICSATVKMIISISAEIVQRASSILVDSALQHQSSGEGSEEDRNRGLIHSVLSLPVTILSVTGKIVVAVVAPVLGHEQQPKGGVFLSPECKSKTVEKTSSTFPPPQRQQQQPYPDYLDRLRLDYLPKEGDSFSGVKLFSDNRKEILLEQSNFLLRVNDLRLRRAEDGALVHYIDLSPTNLDKELMAQALNQLFAGALSILANHPVCNLCSPAHTTTPESQLRWQPEGSTKRILRNMNQLDGTERLMLLQQEIFIWSGRFQHDMDGYGRKHGFFLARGAIGMAPADFVKLLWDNRRTAEYNNFCLGRSTLHCVGDVDEHAILDGTADTATKIIKSEMRVPFAGITVKAVCLMHLRPLPDGGFVIVSRSLDSGNAGTHTAPLTTSKTAKNEILWGCNVIRSVPGRPDVTELTSLSQVGSSVPSFLAQKIGLMGITDFFKNVRVVAATSAAVDQ